MSHLLSPSELHAEAPGVLDVVFGADGEFLLAPMFRPPLWHADGYWVWQYQVDDLTVQPLALDLRVPSVAARLAGLCAQALGVSIGAGWALVCEAHPGVLYRLAGVMTTGRSVTAGAWLSTGRSFRAEAKIWDDVPNPPHGPDPHAFLARLCIALAPRIRDLSRRES